jgi:glycosyltransferase involved in cell wall biosynthesis
VVDNRPWPDRAIDLGTDDDRFRVIGEPRPGISFARNAGIAHSRAPIVAFTDDDAQPDSRWLSALTARFAAAEPVDAVTGLVLPAEIETQAQQWFESFYGGFNGKRSYEVAYVAAEPTKRGAVRHIVVSDAGRHETDRVAIYGVGAFGAGVNMSFRRETLQDAGLFDVDLGTGTPSRGGEDLSMLISILRRGHRLCYEPAAVVRHSHRRSYAELRKQIFGNGLGFTAMLTALIRRDPGHLGALLHLGPAALRAMVGTAAGRLRKSADPSPAEDRSYPRSLVLLEIAGYFCGPVAYWRTVRAARAEQRRAAADRGAR